jgi:hypothetical protein
VAPATPDFWMRIAELGMRNEEGGLYAVRLIPNSEFRIPRC